MSIDTLKIEMTRITGQLKYPGNITHKSRRTSHTHLSQPCSCNFLYNREGSTTETMIIEVVEAKYKADKTIGPSLLWM